VAPAVPEPLRSFDDLAPSLDRALGSLDALRGDYKRQSDAGAVLANSLESLRVELTYNSDAIEGSTLSLRDTQLVIEGRSPGVAKPLREIYEARNHDRALRMVEAWAETRGASVPITERDILDVHAVLLTDIDAGNAGRFRAGRVLISGTRYVPPGGHRFDELIPAMLLLANRTGVHAVLRAAEFHYNLVAVHPFADGNGRTARLAMNYALLRAGFPLVAVPVERRAEYLAALEEANAGRCGPFAGFIVRCVEESIRRLLG
jgi:Fic family protein